MMEANDTSVITVKTASRKWPYLYGITNPDEDVKMTLMDRDGEPLANFSLLPLGYCRFMSVEHLSLTFGQMLMLEPRDEGQTGSVVVRLQDAIHIRPLASELDITLGIEEFREFTKRLEETIFEGRRAKQLTGKVQRVRQTKQR